MEWWGILALFLLIVLFVTLGIIFACILSGQRCTISIQKRTPNHELTRIQQEEEEKRQKQIGSKLKRAFGSSSKIEQPLKPVEDIKTIEFTLKLGNDKTEPEQITTTSESSTDFLKTACSTQAERDARQKRREELRRKYNL